MKKIIVSLCFLAVTTVSQAGFLIEPFLGYNLGSQSQTVGTLGEVDFTYSGVEYGGKLGYSFLGLQVGGYYSMGSYEFDTSDTMQTALGATYTLPKFDGTKMGAFIGFQAPFLFNFWAAYFLSAKYDQTNSTDNTEYTGSGFSIGVGFTLIPMPLASLHLNLEYRSISLDEVKSDAGTVATDLSNQEIVATVSLPINL